MPAWAAFSLLYFAYILAASAARAGLPARARLRAALFAAMGLLLSIAGGSATGFWVRDVLAPPVLLLVAYYASGLLWVRPMPRVEERLAAFDRTLHVSGFASRLPRVACELLEVAYAGVYALIPIALVLHLAWSSKPDAQHFWTVILVTDYGCFAILPWLQTRPPRAVETGSVWRSGFRALNLKLLGRASIGVNTVPSGHAAEALAVALLLLDAPLPVAVASWGCAMAISASAVLGRYHYALDVFAGWAVALGVWMAL
jgi:membrane-associated phospholipid phosphatase